MNTFLSYIGWQCLALCLSPSPFHPLTLSSFIHSLRLHRAHTTFYELPQFDKKEIQAEEMVQKKKNEIIYINDI